MIGAPFQVRYIEDFKKTSDYDPEVSLQANDQLVQVKETIKSAGRKAIQRFMSKVATEEGWYA